MTRTKNEYVTNEKKSHKQKKKISNKQKNVMKKKKLENSTEYRH